MIHLLFLICFVAAAVANSPPPLPTEYSTVVLAKVPYIGLTIPLQVLTTVKNQKIEYFDGLEVDISNANGTFKYHFNNAHRECTYNPASAGPTHHLTKPTFTPKAFLPDLSQYVPAGFENIGGIRCQKFVLDVPHGSTGSMDDHIAFYWDPVLAKPVRWHMHSRHVTFGSHTDEYVMEYVSFQPATPAASEFELPDMCKKTPVRSKVSLRIGAFFDAFLRRRGKDYAPHEHANRHNIFWKNVDLVTELNRQHVGVTTFRGNQFLDLTKEEVLSFRGGKSRSGSREQRRSPEHWKYVHMHETKPDADGLPKSFDWRTAKPGVVGRVKDQAMCGSCWTYGAMGPIETMQAIKSGHLIELPEQYILDCAWTNGTGSSGGNFGCDGGDPDIGALEIIRKYGGNIPTAEAYGSYLSVNGYCKDIQQMDLGARISRWIDIKARDEQGLLGALVAKGSMSVGIMVPDEMLYYDKGVLNVSTCKADANQIDHAVVLVGYGFDPESGLDYYTIRNSWSTNWGDQGYINIVRGEFDCAVASEAGYPELVDSLEEAQPSQQSVENIII